MNREDVMGPFTRVPSPAWYWQVPGVCGREAGGMNGCPELHLVRFRGGMVLWHFFPRGLVLFLHGSLPGQGAVSCLLAVRDLLLWPTSSIVQPSPSCPTSPFPIPGESPHPFRETPFLQKQRQT